MTVGNVRVVYMGRKKRPNMIQWLKRGRIQLQDEKGVSLVESLVAVAILGVAIVASLATLSTGSIAVGIGNQEATAQSLVRSQLEYTKGYPFDSEAATYPAADTYDAVYNPNPLMLPAGYSISAEVSSVPDTDENIQKITVTISRDGEILLVVEDFKVNR